MTLLLLPPSETKRDGGASRGATATYRFPELADARARVREALAALLANSDDEAIARALKVGHRQAPIEMARNRALATAPVMPAIDRYTGVLYDALDAATLSMAARARAGRSVLVQSALFGPIGALDDIPAYRLSADSSLPGLRLKALWATPSTAALGRAGESLVDLRSASYSALGPLPTEDLGREAVSVAVVAQNDDGTVRALNHFNKRGKGLFVRDLLESGEVPASIDALCAHARELGWDLRRVSDTELQLVVPQL